MSIEEFINELSKLNIKITSKNLQDLEIYKNMLLEYNKKFNLTAIKEEKDIYLKHFYDSLTLVKAIDLKKDLSVLDIGTGAGFPGLVLKIIFPNLNITLLDSNHKKISFLKEVIKKLNLKNITCINSRAELLPDEYREYFDLITSRAVAQLRILSELAIPYLKVNGKFVAMKADITNEVIESKNILTQLNSKITDIIKFNLPIENSLRSLVIITKEAKTNKTYPRKYDKILKSK